MSFLSPIQCNAIIDFFSDKFQLDRVIAADYPRGLKFKIKEVAWGHAKLAKELVGHPMQEQFLRTLLEAIEGGVYGPVDYAAVEAQHHGGVFFSEIVEHEYTTPYFAAITALLACREQVPGLSPGEVDRKVSELIEVFGTCSWGHGIERPGYGRYLVKGFAAAGAFPRDTDLGHLEVVSPIFSQLLSAGTDLSAYYSEDHAGAFRSKVLLGAITPLDLVNPAKWKDYKEVFEQALAEDPTVAWVLERAVGAGEIIHLLEDGVKFDPFDFPWHAVQLKASQGEIGQLQEIAANTDIELDNARQLGLLLKANSLDTIPKSP